MGELFDSSKERERNGDVIVGLSSKDQSSNLALALFDIAKQENTSHSFLDKYEKIKKLLAMIIPNHLCSNPTRIRTFRNSKVFR